MNDPVWIYVLTFFTAPLFILLLLADDDEDDQGPGPGMMLPITSPS